MSVNKKAFFVFALTVLIVSPLLADKTAVRIVAPEKAAKGSDLTVTLEVTHDGNNFMHHTEWVYLKVNGVETQKWTYSAFNRPESENFSKTVVLKVDGPLNLEAEGSCNIHGSKGISKALVQPR